MIIYAHTARAAVNMARIFFYTPVVGYVLDASPLAGKPQAQALSQERV
jgi:hypothetical protein